MTKPIIKVAITDDNPLVINGIEKVLAHYPNFELTGTYDNGDALLAGLEQQAPDVLLLDIQMPGKGGEELARIISQRYPAIHILALTGFDTPVYVRSMMQSGCKGYLLKNIDQKVLIEAIETVYRGEQYIESSLKEELLNNMLKLKSARPSTLPDLTPREKDVLLLIVEEYTSVEIAEKLFLGRRTVEKYRLQLLQKLQVKNTAGLVKVALKMGLTGN
ncbi:MAG: response regulator transcription factor [Sphingobacteriales bacterium]|nr:MAG: response regulator transcription factor [Sphingobacteriales bacterium]